MYYDIIIGNRFYTTACRTRAVGIFNQIVINYNLNVTYRLRARCVCIACISDRNIMSSRRIYIQYYTVSSHRNSRERQGSEI